MDEILRQVSFETIEEKNANAQAVVEATRGLVEVAMRRLRGEGELQDLILAGLFEDTQRRRNYLLKDTEVAIVANEIKSQGGLENGLRIWIEEFNNDGELADERLLRLPRDPSLVNATNIGALLDTSHILRGIDPKSVRDLTQCLENAQYKEITRATLH